MISIGSSSSGSTVNMYWLYFGRSKATKALVVMNLVPGLHKHSDDVDGLQLGCHVTFDASGG